MRLAVRRRPIAARGPAAAGLLTALLAGASARAEEPLRISVGLVGVAGVVVLDEPGDQHIEVAGARGEPMGVPTYPGFVGPTAGGGISLELRAFELVGLQLDILRTYDQGHGDLQVSHRDSAHDYTLTVAHDALHLPLLLKALVPGEIVQPMILVGPEFVAPFDAQAEVSEGASPYEFRYDARSETYTMLTVGLGLEIKLGIEALDLRLPVSLRGSVTPEVGDARWQRATYRGRDIHRLSEVELDTTWQYQVAATVGLSAWF